MTDDRKEDRRLEEGGRPPRTRNLKRLIDALLETEDELLFQVRRLNEHVRSRTAEEELYHEDLKHGYAEAARYVRTLRRYHEGRLERLGDRGRGGREEPEEPDERANDEDEDGGAITGGGVARPFTGA